MVQGKRVLRILLIFFGLLAFRATAFATVPSAPGPTRSQAGPQNVCRDLENCWSRLFPAAWNAMSNAMLVVNHIADSNPYEESARRRITAAQTLEAAEQGQLAYQSATCSAYLKECETLIHSAKSKEPIDLIIVGQQYDDNGAVFNEAAQGYYNDRLKKRCGKLNSESQEYSDCKANIVLILQPGRERLTNFLKMLKPGSVQSFTYVGHGLKDAIVLGPRTLTREARPDDTTTRKDWIHEEDGLLYADDLAEGSQFAKIIHTALKSNADLSFYACHTGQQFAGNFADAAGATSAMASTSGMHFGITNAQGKIVSDPGNTGSVRALRAGEHLVLVPDVKGAFKRVSAVPVTSTPDSFADSLIETNSTFVPRKSYSRDELARAIFTSVGAGSAEQAKVTGKGGKTSIVTFSADERRRIKSLLASTSADFRDQATLEDLLGLLRKSGDAPLRDKLSRVIQSADADHETSTRARSFTRKSFGLFQPSSVLLDR